jgi:hypothetical protein
LLLVVVVVPVEETLVRLSVAVAVLVVTELLPTKP